MNHDATQALLAASLKKITNEHDKLYKLWLKRNNTIIAYSAEISEIDNHLNSLMVKVNGLFKGRAINDQADLIKSDNRKLTKQELLLKKETIQRKIQQLDLEAVDFAARLQQFKVEILAIQKQQHANTRQQINKLFSLNPQSYLASLQLNEHELRSDQDIFSYANDLILVIDELESFASPTQLLNFLQTLMSAQNRALKLFAVNQDAANANLYSKYSLGFKAITKMLIYQNFNGMAEIKYLLDLGEEQQVKEYITELAELYKHGDLAACESLLQKIALHLETVSFAQSFKVLAKNKLFAALPVEEQNFLTQQHVYVERLKFNLKNLAKADQTLDLQQINELSVILEANIVSCLNGLEKKSLVAAEFEKITALIEQRQSQLYAEILKKAVAEHYKGLGVTAGILSALLAITAVNPLVPMIAVGAVASKAANLYVAGQSTPAMEKLKVLDNLAKKLSKEDFKEIIALDQFWQVGNGLEQELDFAAEVKELKSVKDLAVESIKHNILEPGFANNVQPEINKAKNKVLTFGRSVMAITLGGTTLAVLAWSIVALALFGTLGTLPPVWPIFAVAAATVVVGILARLVYGDKLDNFANSVFKAVTGADFKDSLLRRVSSRVFNMIYNIGNEPIADFNAAIKEQRHAKVLLTVTLTSALIVSLAVVTPLVAPSLGLAGGVTLGIFAGGILGFGLSSVISKIAHKFKQFNTDMVRDDFTVVPNSLAKLQPEHKELIVELTTHFKKRAKDLYQQIDDLKKVAGDHTIAINKIVLEIESLSVDWQGIQSSIGSPEFFDKGQVYLRNCYLAERAKLVSLVKDNSQISNKGLGLQFTPVKMERVTELRNLKESLDKVKMTVQF